MNKHGWRSFSTAKAHEATMAISALLLLIGCGSSSTPIPTSLRIAEKPDVVITFDGERHTCVVGPYSEAQGSMVSCADVVPFIREELRLPNGAIYDIRTIPDVDPAEMARVQADLQSAGYRFIGGPHVMLLTGPHQKGR